jgi:predicted ArsR family transcriptional regulator
MELPGFRELVKPQWVALIGELKISGGLPVSELATRLEMSYMGVRQHCETLRKMGYLERWRVPHGVVGRPEIFYRLAAKSDVLFPQAGSEVTLEILESVKLLFGQAAPERLLHQYFQQQADAWRPKLSKAKSLVERATLLTGLREKAGCFTRCKYDAEKGFRIEEYHHPLKTVFAVYPHAVGMEMRAMEQLLGSKVTRREIPGGRGGPARVDYEVATLGVR